MIYGIGVDLVEIKRFERWSLFTKNRLERIFSPLELDYAFAMSAKTAERLAVRFAAKEAFFKALASGLQRYDWNFLNCAKAVQIVHRTDRAPQLAIDWDRLNLDIMRSARLIAHLSLSHSNLHAVAYVLLEEAP